MEERGAAVGEDVVSAWDGRRGFVTGATVLVGSWLVRALLERGSQVTALVREADPQSELLRSGDLARTTVVNGEVQSLHTLLRALNHHRPDGTLVRDYVYVKEVAEAYLALAEHVHRPDVRGEAVAEISRQYLSSARARAVLGWQARYTLAMGLGETVEWYRRFLANRAPRP